MKTTKISGWLVMAAALLVMTMGMTACSSESDDILGQDSSEQPKETAGVRVTVSAGISDDEGTTRSTVEMDGTKRVLKFTTGDKLYVWKKVGEPGNPVIYMAGMLDMVGDPSADGLSATFTGEVMGYDNYFNEYDCDAEGDPLVGTEATLVHAAMVKGTDYSISKTDRNINIPRSYATDVETLMTTRLRVKGSYTSGCGYSLASVNPIIYCSLSGLAVSTTYSASLQYPASEGGYYEEGNGSFTTDAYGAGSVAFEARGNGTHDWRIAIKQGDNTVGSISLGSRELGATVYNVSRKWTGSAFVKYVNLTGQTGDVTVKDGYTVEGTLSGHQLLIADGATVTLSGASVTGPEGTGYGAIRCLGDATIILADGTTNMAQSGKGNEYAAVSVPDGKTLTINGGSAGTGTLVADARVDGDLGRSRAGICAGDNISGGDVTIAGGAVTAYGINNAAGIGGGYNCNYGNVTITGGNVSATGGSDGGAGIGSNGGYGRNYGNIRIEGGNVTATGGSNGGAGIGSGKDGLCGDISISGGTVNATGGSGGAGIGSGKDGLCGNISISGGTVNATGGSGGAGIGSGKSGSVSGNITITDGADYIYAEKSGNCRCIGKGESGKCGTVRIDGQTITDDMYDDEYDVEDFPSFPNFNLTLDEDCDYKTSESWTLTKK